MYCLIWIKKKTIKKKNVWSEMGDFEILDSNELIDFSKDIIKCEKPRQNSITKFDNISVNIIG